MKLARLNIKNFKIGKKYKVLTEQYDTVADRYFDVTPGELYFHHLMEWNQVISVNVVNRTNPYTKRFRTSEYSYDKYLVRNLIIL